MLLLRIKAAIVFVLLTLSGGLLAGDPASVHLGCRLPVLNTQALDVIVPRVGIEYLAPKTKFINSFELGMPVHTTYENKNGKGLYIGGQCLFGLLSESDLSGMYLGVRASYMRFEFQDYLRYENTIGFNTYSHFKLSDIQKTRLNVGFCFLRRYHVFENLSFEWQFELGYTSFSYNHDDQVKQISYHNSIFNDSDNYDSPTFGAGINLYYKLY